ncbi:hypothetical protein GCK72_013157 [Caenorhabditis remanei]|uniref:Uncharacterized protein n=1 Tax=Caenorhabditis remanei TaxID=31234 RepID=A0A6A5GQ29_CAERE|nr:hypothetical protein GCK72_013157 [Caenorhabditis remanei]KAF1756703.1 hypothetical protein GCK72_013157 [Caenorhabditis remanei]
MSTGSSGDKPIPEPQITTQFGRVESLISAAATQSSLAQMANDEKPGESINKRLQNQQEGCPVESVFDKNMETLRKPDTATLFVALYNSTHDDEFPWSFKAVSELINIRSWSSSCLAYISSKARKAIAKGNITISTSKCHVCFTIMDDCYETHKFEDYHQMILCRWSMQSYSKHASPDSPYLKNL